MTNYQDPIKPKLLKVKIPNWKLIHWISIGYWDFKIGN